MHMGSFSFTWLVMMSLASSVWWFCGSVSGTVVDGTAIGIENGNYYSEDPDIAEKCLYYSDYPLTSACATEVYVSIGKKKVEMSIGCCRRVVKLGKTCWANILSLDVDDPCRFFPQIFHYCMQVAPEYVPGLGRKGGGGKVPPGPNKVRQLEEIYSTPPPGCNKFT